MKLITLDFWKTLAEANPEHAEHRNQIIYDCYRWKHVQRTFEDPEMTKLDLIRDFKFLKNHFDAIAEKYPTNSFSPEQCYATILFMLGYQGGDPDFDNHMQDLEEQFKQNFFKYPPILYPNVKEVIKKLSETYELGVITNLNYMRGEWLREYLKQELPEISFVISSDERGYSKPSSYIFDDAFVKAEHIGGMDDYILHVGDNPIVDGGIKNFLIDAPHCYFQINSNDKTITDIYEHLQIFSK